MLKDSRGLEISTNSAEVIEICENFKNELLTMGTGVGDILAHAENHKDEFLIQAYLAALWLYGRKKGSDKGMDSNSSIIF